MGRLLYIIKLSWLLSDVLHFISLPDQSPAIKQPEGIKKELTQSSLVCTKGKVRSVTHSRQSVELLHCLAGLVL